MMSRFAYWSFKDINPGERIRFARLLLIPLVIIVIAVAPQVTIFVLFVIYAASGPSAWLGTGAARSERACVRAPHERARAALSRGDRDHRLQRRGFIAQSADLPSTPGEPGSVARDAAAAPLPAVETPEAWERLAAEVRACTLCALHKTRTQTVFGVGRRDAELFVIGEAPGADEDRQGEPFVGRAGQLLNAMLRAIGLPRSEVYIANILKCRPPEIAIRSRTRRACAPVICRARSRS